TGNTFFAVGSENFALADQIGSFSARTYGGGLRFCMTSSQDFDGYIAKQDRSEEHTSELQSRQYLHSFPTRRSSDLTGRPDWQLFSPHIWRWTSFLHDQFAGF